MSTEGFVDVGGLGISYGDIIDQTVTDVSSWVDEFGTEYLGWAPVDLNGVPFSEGVAYQEAGSFAGYGDWFDGNYPGDIVSGVPEGYAPVSGGFEGVTTNLVSQDFTSIASDPTVGGQFTLVDGVYIPTEDLATQQFNSIVSDFKEYVFGPTQLDGIGSGSILTQAKDVISSGYKTITDYVGKLFGGTTLSPSQYGSAGYTWPGANGVTGTPFDDNGVLNVGWKVDELGQPYYDGGAINIGSGLNILSDAETARIFNSPLIRTFLPTTGPTAIGGVDPNVLSLIKTTASLVGVNPNIVTAAAVTANDPSVANLIKLTNQIVGSNILSPGAQTNPYGAQLGVGNVLNYQTSTSAVNPNVNPQVGGLIANAQGILVPVDSTEGRAILVERSKVQNSSPQPVGAFYSYRVNPLTGTYEVFNEESGEVVASGLSQDEAIKLAQDYSIEDPYYNPPTSEDPNALREPTDADAAEAAAAQNAKINAWSQAEQQRQRKQVNDVGDWRVRLRLAPGGRYLYQAEDVGPVLWPLRDTDGIIFPYTPQITTAYRANYNSYDLPHSNYRGYFYQNSFVDDIQLQATFTAQDTYEANYLLAVITFFKSVTKMFYGQDAQRGAPPPLVFLQGLGEYQFNLNPCVVAQFNYNLPSDVDYIRAQSPNINGTNLLQKRSRTALPTDTFTSAYARIQNLLKAQNINKGAIDYPPTAPTLGQNSPTYVPTKIDMTIILHPVQTREQVSQTFSLKSFANGNLLKGGYW